MVALYSLYWKINFGVNFRLTESDLGVDFSIWLRGGIKIENRKIWDNIPIGGVKKIEMSPFQFGNFENRGGVSIFQKCSNIKYFMV